MNSRDAQDLVLHLLADGPFRATAMQSPGSLGAETAATLARMDLAGLDRFGRFLCRHYYRERVVHYFKYSRALAPLTRRQPERALKTPEFNTLMPHLILSDRASATLVLDILRRFLAANADGIRAKIPYWDDLVEYQCAFFLSDALPPASAPARFPARAETTTLVSLSWDLPAVLPQLLKPFKHLPLPPQKPIRLLLARSPYGEVTALRCTDALKNLLDRLTGDVSPKELAAAMQVDVAAFEKTLRQLEQVGAVVAQESFSSSHVGSEVPSTPQR